MENLTIDFLAQTLGHDPAAIKGMFVEQAEGEEPKPLTGEAFTAKAAEWLKAETARFYQSGEKHGKRTRMTEFENSIRQRYNVQANQQGEALVDAVVAAKTAEMADLQRELAELKAKPGSKKLEEIDPEQANVFVANHPLFSKKVQELTAQIQEKETAFEAFKTQIVREQTFNNVKSYANDFLETEYRPVYPDVPEIAQNLKSVFMDSLLRAAEWRMDENGKPVPYDPKTGERVINPVNYTQLSTPEFLTAQAKKFFVPHPVDPNKGAPGASGGQTQGGATPDWRKFNGDKSAIMTEILSEKDSAKQRLLLKSAEPYL